MLIRKKIINCLISLNILLLILSFFKFYYEQNKDVFAQQSGENSCLYLKWQGPGLPNSGIVPQTVGNNVLGQSPISINNNNVYMRSLDPSRSINVNILGNLKIIDSNDLNKYFILDHNSPANTTLLMNRYLGQDATSSRIAFYIGNIEDVNLNEIDYGTQFNFVSIYRKRRLTGQQLDLQMFDDDIYSTKVGIGTLFPNEKLDVFGGNIRVNFNNILIRQPSLFPAGMAILGIGNEERNQWFRQIAFLGNDNDKNLAAIVIGGSSVNDFDFIAIGKGLKYNPYEENFFETSSAYNNFLTIRNNGWIGVKTNNPEALFHIKNRSTNTPAAILESFLATSGLVLDIRKSFFNILDEDPYIVFSRQADKDDPIKKFGYIQGGLEGIKIFSQPVVIEEYSLDLGTAYGGSSAIYFQPAVMINPNGGQIILGNNKLSTTSTTTGSATLKIFNYLASSTLPLMDLKYASGNLKIYYDNPRGALVFHNARSKVSFLINNNLVLTISSTGVGIGNNNPQYRLHVNGTTSVSNLIVNDTSSMSRSIVNELTVLNRINYSRGVRVYRINSECPGAGSLTLETNCRTSDNRLVGNIYVGKLIE